MRFARLTQSLPAISGPHVVGSLERQHPPGILGGKSADLIQGRPRLPVVPRRRYCHDVAALQVQPSTVPAATLSKSSKCAD